MPKGELRSDGTMDTVIACSECGEEQRYTFAGDGEETYDEFVEWALMDFDEEHVCQEEAEEEADDD